MLKQVETVPVLKISFEYQIKALIYRDAFWNFVSYLDTNKIWEFREVWLFLLMVLQTI